MPPDGAPRPEQVNEALTIEADRSPTPPWFGAALVVASTALILIFMLGIFGAVGGRSESVFAFPSLFLANTPTGGDLGAHVLLPAIIRESLFSGGSVIGWSGAWFAGFPVLYFYFPLPMLTVVAFDVLLPYGVALKLVTITGLVALPTAVFYLLRRLGLDSIAAGVGSFGAAVFVFMESYAIYGGNIKSTLAGEFSFSWSLTLALVYLALVVRDTNEARGFTPWPGVVLALVTLSHVVSTIVIVVASVLLLRRAAARPVIVGSWILGFGITAFWSVPFSLGVVRGLTTDMDWAPVTQLVGDESPLPLEILPVLAIAAASLWWVVRRPGGLAFVVGLGAIPLVAYLLVSPIGVNAVNNARFLPYWYLTVHVVAGVGLGLIAVTVGRRLRVRPNGVAVLSSLLAVLAMLFVVGKMADVPGWVEWDFSGYEGKSEYGEYQDLMETVDALPPGRIMWEEDERNYAYGTELALMLFPYWSEEHPSMAGLYYESSLTTPFNLLNASELSAESSERIPTLVYHGLDPVRGMRHLDVYGVRYYVTSTDEAEMAASLAGLRPLATSDPWVIFAASDGELVSVASTEPTVWAGRGGFVEASLEWYDDVDNLDRWMVADGPEGWRRIASVEERLDSPEKEYSISEAAVSDIVVDDQRISFTTNAVGVPHMVKVSYFPNWGAAGADGPYRAAPSLMVVVPTSEEVVLTFEQTWVEHLGNGLSLVTLAGLAVWWLWSRRFKRPTGSTAMAEIEVPQ